MIDNTESDPVGSKIKDAVYRVGVTRMAKELGVTRQTIYNWLFSGKIPAEKVIAIEILTGLPRTTIRPDIYPVQ